MTPALLDTDILSLFFRGDEKVVARVQAYLAEHGQLNLSIITYYEILSGLKHRDARRQLAEFEAFVADSTVVPLTEASVRHSADAYAATRAQGAPVDDIDLLIAGIALEHGWTLVTHNTEHFGRIAGLVVLDWAA